MVEKQATLYVTTDTKRLIRISSGTRNTNTHAQPGWSETA
jgi:hypothetical protein